MRKITRIQRRTVILAAAVLSACVFLSACEGSAQSETEENSMAAYEHDPAWGGNTTTDAESYQTITPTPEENPDAADVQGSTVTPTETAQTGASSESSTQPENVTYQEVSDKVMVAVNTLNLRYGPSTDYTIYRKSTYGEVFDRIGIGSNGWDRILVEGITCYAYAAYMDPYVEQEESDDVTDDTATEDGSDGSTSDENGSTETDSSFEGDGNTTDNPMEDTTGTTPVPGADSSAVGANAADTSDTTDTENTSDTALSGSLDSLKVVSLNNPKYDYIQMVEDLTALDVAYPDSMHLSSIGSTADGRTIYDVAIGNADAEQSILIVAGMEGCYYTTTQLVMKQIEYYVSCYNTASYDGSSLTSLFDKTIVHVIPMLNPDGVFISQYGLDGIASADISSNVSSWFTTAGNSNPTSLVFADYLKFWTANAKGVDINKNFSYGWDTCISTGTPMNSGYKGTAAESETETKAIADFIRTRQPKAVLCYNGYNNQILWDYGQTEEVRKTSNAVVTAVQYACGYSIVNYTEGSLQGGSLAEWAVLDQGIPVITVTAGTNAAAYDNSVFESLWSSNRDIWAAILKLFK